jgi:hypothetical protein
MATRAERAFSMREYAVDRDGAATFSNQVLKGHAGEEQHEAVV